MGAPNKPIPYIASDLAGLGGCSAMLRFVSAAAGAGLDFWDYAGGSGLRLAADLHACAGQTDIRGPPLSLLRWQPFDVIAKAPFVPAINPIAVPDGPGLGLTSDHGKLRFTAKQ